MNPLRREPIRRAVREGWRATITNGGHVRLVHPTGAVYVTGATPGDRRVEKHIRTGLRRELRKQEGRS